MLHLCLSLLAVAPTLDGSPRLRMDQISGTFSDLGGRFAIKPVLTGPDEDRLGAFAFIDTRSGRTRDRSQGTFLISVFDGPTEKLRTGRRVTFDARGWTETATDGALSSTLRVTTLSRNVYLARLTLSAPLTVTARVEGTVATTATYDQGLLTLDDADRPPFGLMLDARGATPVRSGAGGATYSASVSVSASSSVDFLVAFDETPAHARDVLTAAPMQPVVLDWTVGLSKPHSTDAKYLATEQRALSVLRMGEVTSPDGTVLGGAAAKSHYNEIWVWDSAFQVLAVSEWDAPRAFAHLEGVYRGQVKDGPEAGLLYNHVDEAGKPVRLELPGYTDEFSQAPAIGFVMNTLYERSAKDDAAKALLQRSFDVAVPYLDWWARRRDADQDGLAEFNGGWESGWDNSPRFTEVWGDGLTARLPADDADPRPRLNSVDLNAWLYLYLVELSRSATLLGRDDAKTYEDRAAALAAKIDDAANGFWDDASGRYADFTKGGGRRRFTKTRTPVTLWPLFAGLVRDEARAKRVIENDLLDPAKLWGAYGIPTVAFDDPAFDSNEYWRGPVWLNVSYLAMIALFRYGYETEAEELKVKTLELASSDHGLWEYYDSKTGAGLNVYQFGWSAALFMEALRDRHQAEAFAVGTKREGSIRRLQRLEDGAVLAEVSVEGTAEVPVTTFAAAAGSKLFDGSEVSMTFADPHGVAGAGVVTVRFPAYPQVEPLTGRVGDTVTVRGYERRGCGCSAASGPLLLVLLFGCLRVCRRR